MTKLIVYLRSLIIVAAIVGLVYMLSVSRDKETNQDSPDVINFLAGGYCPEIHNPNGPPLKAFSYIFKGKADARGLFGPKDAFPAEYWEDMAAKRHSNKEAGYSQPWKIRFLGAPRLGQGLQESWALTRLMGGMAPQIMTAQVVPKFTQTAHDWFVDLTPYLKKPNPYVEKGKRGSKRWMDQFYPNTLTRWQSTYNKKIYCIPIDLVEVGIFYNKTILRDCGVDVDGPNFPPNTWAEFIAIQKRVKDKGYVPTIIQGADKMVIKWIYMLFSDMLYDDLSDKIEVLTDTDLGIVNVDAQELVRAYKKGYLVIGNDRWWEAWRLTKEWSQYWQRGYLGERDTLNFQRGKAAFTLYGSWYVERLMKDKLDFEFGVFPVPKLTKASSKFATGVEPRGVGGATATQYAITRGPAERKEAVEACVDLLRWLTAPKNIGPAVAEAKSFLPAIYDAKITEHLKFLQKIIERGMVRYTGIEISRPRVSDTWWATMQSFLEGNINKAEVVKTMEVATQRAIYESTYEKRATWQWIKDSKGNQTWEIKLKDNEVLTRDYLRSKAKAHD